MVRLLPETARVCARSVSLKASSSSGVMRAVSPTTSPGSSARASAGNPSVASRSPARNRPANRWAPDGFPTTSGTGWFRTRSTAATRSPLVREGASRAVTRSRVDGSSPSQGERSGPPADEPGSTINSTGARVSTTVPSVCSTRRTSASISTETGAG